MSKNSTKLKVTFLFNDEETKDLGVYALNMVTPSIQQNLDDLLRRNGAGKTDTLITYDSEKSTFIIEAKPTDKGDVLIASKKGELVVVPYKSLKDKNVYAHIKEGRTFIYQYIKDDVDFQIGAIKSLDMAAKELSRLPQILEEQEANRQAIIDEQKNAELSSNKEVSEPKMEVVIAD